MELNYLSEFITLSKIGNYLEASDELFISQSTLSKHIQALEKELGVTLFDRTTRRVQLSEDGKRFLPYAVKIVHLRQEYTSALRASSRRGGKVTLASTSQMLQYSVVDALTQYGRTQLPGQLDITVDHHKNLKNLLRQEKADFIWSGETSGESEEKGFTRIHFMDDPMVVLLPNSHPMAGRQSVSLAELKGCNIVMQDNSSVEQQVFLDTCRQRGLQFGITSIPTGKMMLEFVSQNIGIAIMLRTPALNMRCDAISILDIENSPVVHVNLIYLEGRPLSPAARQFLQFLERWKSGAEKGGET